MFDAPIPRWLLVSMFLALLGVAACSPDDDEIVVEGTVENQAFTATAGTAEELSDGSYVLTLSSSGNYTCDSQPEVDYLTVVLTNFEETGEYSASGNVTFNSIEGQVINQEGATSGRFYVEIFEDASDPYITGDLDVTGEDSRANGTFEVPICE